MGKGNPESADAAFARNTHIFVADTLSAKNKTQFNDNRKEWVELRRAEGFKRFGMVLDHLDILTMILMVIFNQRLVEILDEIFQ